MNDLPSEPVSVEVAGWGLITSSTQPAIESSYRKHAELQDAFDDFERGDGRGYFFSAIGRGNEDWPSLVVTQWFSPSAGFSPGVPAVPERQLAVIGAGTRLSATGGPPTGGSGSGRTSRRGVLGLGDAMATWS